MWHLFLDESGDLGFNFDEKHSSRFLTISILAVSQPGGADAIRNAIKKTLRRKVNCRKRGRKHPAVELKGTRTAQEVKCYFYDQIRHVDFGIYAMTLDKQKVRSELRDTPRKLDRIYTYVAGQLIAQIPFEPETKEVYLTVDRSKGKQGIAEFDSHIVTQLESRLDPSVVLRIRHSESNVDLGLSAADLFCWGVFRTREREDQGWYDYFREKIRLDDLYQ